MNSTAAAAVTLCYL